MVAAHNVTALLELTNLVQMTINVIRVHFITIHPKITLQNVNNVLLIKYLVRHKIHAFHINNAIKHMVLS